MIRRHFFLFAAGAFLVLLLVAGAVKLIAFNDKKPSGPGGGGRAQAVSQAVATPHAFSDSIDVLGVAKGRQSVNITSNTTELVTAVHFSDGQYVQKGQVLVTLKADEQDASIAQTQAVLGQAERDYTRWKTLADRGVAPRATAEQYLAALETARANVDAAKARKLNRVIRAPFAGVVGLSDVAPGSLIAPGATIVTLDDLGVIRVDFPVPDRYLPVMSQGSNIVARPDAYPGESFTGRIALLDTRVDATTRAITARAEFPNPSARIKPGMLMRVSVAHGARQGITVPEQAIQYEGDQAFVFKFAKDGERTVARKTKVTTGATDAGVVEVTSGLAQGEKVVADGLNRVQDGQAVHVGGGKGGRSAAKAG